MTCGVRNLWLPIHHPARAWLASALVLIFHLGTMSRDMSAYDSAELALVAHQLGLSHPIGQPLHAVAGWFFAHLPGVSPLVGLNLLSALSGALCLIPAFALAQRLAPQVGWEKLRVGGPALLCAMAMHAALWEPSTRVEVYALASFLTLWGTAKVLTAQPQARSSHFASGFVLGLAACTNLVIAAIAAAAIGPTVVTRCVSRTMSAKTLAAWVLGGMIGLLPYLYVPLVALRSPTTFLWGRPRSLDTLWFFLSGSDYRHNQQTSLGDLGSHLVAWTEWSLIAGVLPFLLLGVSAFAWLGARARTGRWVALLSAGLSILFVSYNTVFDPRIPDYLGYLMVPMWLSTAATVALLARWVEEPSRFRIYAYVAGVVLFAGSLMASPPITTRTRHADRLLRVMAEGALREAPPGAFLIVSSDHWVAPLWYLQEAEGTRPDVVILPPGMASSSWYWEHLFARHPHVRPIDVRVFRGRLARITGLLRENPTRSVLVEVDQDARELGLAVCAVGWLSLTGPMCDGYQDSPGTVSEALRRALSEVGLGAPSTAGVAANVGMTRGAALWRLGQSAAAFEAFMAGVPPELRPDGAPDAKRLAALPPLRRALPMWQQTRPIGDPRRNLYLAGRMLLSSGQPSMASDYVARAAELGLPEAAEVAGRASAQQSL